MSASKPIWDRGDAIDPQMLAFTVGDDWLLDRRLVEHDLEGSLAHCDGLLAAELIDARDAATIRAGLEIIRKEHREGAFTVNEGDEDVHSAIENRLIALVGDAGKKLHTARSRNEQVALDVRLWLRASLVTTGGALDSVVSALDDLAARRGALPLPGYTHLRRAMPSSLADFAQAHSAALRADRGELELARTRASRCPLGSGAGYGVPVALDREATARALGFEGPDEPVTYVQHSRGRAELAYLTALEAIALDAIKLATDLWLFSSEEFGFAKLPVELTTGSSMMPQKRNPDLLELIRAHGRQVLADRDAAREVIRDLPSGYHRDFQLVKGPLFRAHDRIVAMLPLLARVVTAIEWDESRLAEAASDPKLEATARALAKAKSGIPFRDAYRQESRGEG
jgi:argininosuccinate lyase